MPPTYVDTQSSPYRAASIKAIPNDSVNGVLI